MRTKLRTHDPDADPNTDPDAGARGAEIVEHAMCFTVPFPHAVRTEILYLVSHYALLEAEISNLNHTIREFRLLYHQTVYIGSCKLRHPRETYRPS